MKQVLREGARRMLIHVLEIEAEDPIKSHENTRSEKGRRYEADAIQTGKLQ